MFNFFGKTASLDQLLADHEAAEAASPSISDEEAARMEKFHTSRAWGR